MSQDMVKNLGANLNPLKNPLALTPAGWAAGAAGVNATDLVVNKLNPLKKPPTPGVTGYEAGGVDTMAAQLNGLAGQGGNASILTPAQRLASQGSIDNIGLVQPKIDALSNLFSVRNAYLKQKSIMPGLRNSTSGSLLSNLSKGLLS